MTTETDLTAYKTILFVVGAAIIAYYYGKETGRRELEQEILEEEETNGRKPIQEAETRGTAVANNGPAGKDRRGSKTNI